MLSPRAYEFQRATTEREGCRTPKMWKSRGESFWGQGSCSWTSHAYHLGKRSCRLLRSVLTLHSCQSRLAWAGGRGGCQEHDWPPGPRPDIDTRTHTYKHIHTHKAHRAHTHIAHSTHTYKHMHTYKHTHTAHIHTTDTHTHTHSTHTHTAHILLPSSLCPVPGAWTKP